VNPSKAVPGSLRPGAATALIGWLMQREEQRRARLAYVLHRDVAGTLAAVRMDVARAVAGLGDKHGPLRESLGRIDELVEQAIRSARHEMQHLHPALIDHFGLAAAVRHRVEEAGRAAPIVYTLELVEQVEAVELPLQLAAYRAVECLLDARELREIAIRLDARREHYVLKVVGQFESPGAAEGVASELLALRTWIESLGASWSEGGAGAARRQLELRLPRAAPVVSPAQG
jgi:signal transduction histidine kinase